MTLCQKCSKRATCTELCAAAEQYVNQDYVSQQHLIPNEPISYVTPLPSVTKSKEEQILLLYFIDRLTQQQVADKVYVSRPYVSKVVKKYKGIMSEIIKKSVTS